MRILITCRELSLRAGSQLYTRDLALALRRSGHEPVVFSPTLGEVAAEVRERGVPVISDLDQLGVAPDLIHGQHHLQAMAAMMRFPEVPAIFVCHGWLPWQEAPPRFPTIRRYVVVDTLRRDRLVLEHGIAPEMVEIVGNFVDLDRFVRRHEPLPSRPRRALLFSNNAGENELSAAVREACSSRGLELEIVGLESGRPVSRPELLLPEFDLVFARGRAALEAMAAGAAVVLCDVEGDGPLVTSGNFDVLKTLNFGIGALQRPFDARRLAAAVDGYDPADAGRVCERVRAKCGLPEAVGHVVRIYEDAIARHRPGASREETASIAGSRYLEWLGPFVEQQVLASTAEAVRATSEAAARSEQQRIHLHTLLQQRAEERDRLAEAERLEIDELRRTLVAAEESIRELQAARSATQTELNEARVTLARVRETLTVKEARLAEVENRLTMTSHTLDVLQHSPFSKARAALLRFDPGVRLYKRLTGRGRQRPGK